MQRPPPTKKPTEEVDDATSVDLVVPRAAFDSDQGDEPTLVAAPEEPTLYVLPDVPTVTRTVDTAALRLDPKMPSPLGLDDEPGTIAGKVPVLVVDSLADVDGMRRQTRTNPMIVLPTAPSAAPTGTEEPVIIPGIAPKRGASAVVLGVLGVLALIGLIVVGGKIGVKSASPPKTTPKTAEPASIPSAPLAAAEPASPPASNESAPAAIAPTATGPVHNRAPSPGRSTKTGGGIVRESPF